MEADHIHFARRATDERQAADSATDRNARARHVELAERLEDLARALEARRIAFG